MVAKTSFAVADQFIESGRAAIIVMQPDEYGEADDLARALSFSLGSNLCRNSLFKSLVWTGLVEELNIFLDNSMELTLSED